MVGLRVDSSLRRRPAGAKEPPDLSPVLLPLIHQIPPPLTLHHCPILGSSQPPTSPYPCSQLDPAQLAPHKVSHCVLNPSSASASRVHHLSPHLSRTRLVQLDHEVRRDRPALCLSRRVPGARCCRFTPLRGLAFPSRLHSLIHPLAVLAQLSRPPSAHRNYRILG